MGIRPEGEAMNAYSRPDDPMWQEYDAAANWMAKHGYRGNPGDPLPVLLSIEVQQEINQHPDEFQERIRDFAYAHAMGY